VTTNKFQGLNWLKKNDALQIQWAADYIKKRKPNYLLFLPQVTHANLISVGMHLEEEESGREILRNMKNAWRQKKYRSPSNGRKACTFSLSTYAKKSLTRLAGHYQLSETALIEKLIEEERLTERLNRQQSKMLIGFSRRSLQDKNSYNSALDKVAKHLEQFIVLLAKLNVYLDTPQQTRNEYETVINQLVIREISRIKEKRGIK